MLAKKFALAFGIAMLMPFLVYYGVSSFSPAPRYEQTTYNDIQYDNDATKTEREKARKINEQKQEEFKKKQKHFQRHLFYVAAPLGLISLIVGSVLAVPAVGTGLMFGGVFTFTEGFTYNWSEIRDSLKFVLLLLTFVILIWIGYVKLSTKPGDKSETA
jgi:hypothetical protein